jgi:hypothetical protein
MVCHKFRKRNTLVFQLQIIQFQFLNIFKNLDKSNVVSTSKKN